MPLEHLLTTPIEELNQRLINKVDGFSIGIRAVKIEKQKLYIAYSVVLPQDPCPYRTEFNPDTKELNVLYDLTSGSVFGHSICSAATPIPEGTKKLVFRLDNADSIDKRTGKRMRDLDKYEFLEHFFPNLKRGNYEFIESDDPDQLN